MSDVGTPQKRKESPGSSASTAAALQLRLLQILDSLMKSNKTTSTTITSSPNKKKALDLRSIRRLLAAGRHYTSPSDCVRDIRHVLTEAQPFEQAYSKALRELNLYEEGPALDLENSDTPRKRPRRTVRIIRPTAAVDDCAASATSTAATSPSHSLSSSSHHSATSLDERSRVSAALFQLTAAHLKSILEMIADECPAALNKTAQVIEVSMDALPVGLLRRVAAVVEEKQQKTQQESS